MPRIKIISKLPKAADGIQIPPYNFTGGNSQSVWGQGNNTMFQPQAQEQTQPIQQQAASPQMFTPTGNVPQSMWGQQQAPAAQPYSVPKTGAWWENNADEPIEPPIENTTAAAPNNGLLNQSTGLSKQFTGEDYDQPGYKGYKGPKKPSSNFMSGLSKINNTIDQVATIGNMALGYFDKQKKQKEYNNWMSQSMLPHNYYAVNTKKNRGDYDINNGMFQPDKLGYKSKGTQANNIGAMSTFARYGGSLPKAEEGWLVEGDKVPQKAFLPNLSTVIPTAKNMYSSGTGFDPGLPLMNKSSVDNSVEALANVQAKLESGYDPTKPPTAKENVKAWNVTASKNIYGKWQVSKDERKEAYKNLPELKKTFSTFQEYDNAFLGKNTAELQQQVQDITYKKFLAPRNLQLAGGDIFAAALYHYLPAAAKLYTEGKLDLNLKPGQLFPNNKMLVNADKVNPTFGSYLNRFKKEYIRQKEHNVFEQGGENLNDTNMKIRIIEGPNEEMANGGEPQYSGQSDYGLYIGQRNLYNTMAKSPFTDAGTTVEEKPEDEESPYVLEAEGGETILRPDGSHMKINGPSHAEGGVKLNKDQAPEGSFIYSDTNKMKIKNPKILEYFGKSAKKGGITPAELAKQYDVNKYLGILKDPDTDKLSKQTAQRMVENYQKKLAELALAQESIKGFPQGIPEVAKSIAGGAQNPQQGQNPQEQQTAKYGGALHKFVTGGSNIMSNDPFGIKSLIQKVGTVNTSTGDPVKNQSTQIDKTTTIPPQKNNDYLNNPKSPFYSPNAEPTTSAVSVPKTVGNTQIVTDPKSPFYSANSQTPSAVSVPKTVGNTQIVTDPKSPFYSANSQTPTYNNLNTDFKHKGDTKKYLDFNKPDEAGGIWSPERYDSEWKPAVSNTMNNPDKAKKVIDYLRQYPGANAGVIKSILDKAEASGNINEAITKLATDKQVGPFHNAVMDAMKEIEKIPEKIPETVHTTTAPPGVMTTTTKIPVPGIEITTTKPAIASWTNIDKRNLLNAGIDYASLKKYHPYSATIQPVLPEFTPTDWRGYAATLQSGANKAADQLGTYGAGQGMASNLSFLAGQQAGQLGDYISKVDQYNAAGSSNVDAQRANILNQFTQYNAANRDKNFAEENVYDDRYRTAERLARKGALKAWNQGDENAAHIYNLNQVESPYYTIDAPSQQIRFNSPGAKAAWEASTKGPAPRDQDEMMLSRIEKFKESPAFSGYNDETEKMNAISKFLEYGSAGHAPYNKKSDVTVNPITKTRSTQTTYDRDGNPLTEQKFGGGVGASFVKSISDWYSKLNYIANPNERQRLAEAYARKMHFGK